MNNHLEKMKSDLSLIPLTKISSKWIKGLNLKCELKNYQKKIWENLLDIGFRDGILDMTPKAQATKSETSVTIRLTAFSQ